MGPESRTQAGDATLLNDTITSIQDSVLQWFAPIDSDESAFPWGPGEKLNLTCCGGSFESSRSPRTCSQNLATCCHRIVAGEPLSPCLLKKKEPSFRSSTPRQLNVDFLLLCCTMYKAPPRSCSSSDSIPSSKPAGSTFTGSPATNLEPCPNLVFCNWYGSSDVGRRNQ